MTESSQLDERILIFAPVGKDAPLTAEVLARAGLEGYVCASTTELCDELRTGAAAILLTEEALEDKGIGELMEALRTQPAWSDIPILLFADTERSEVYLRTLRLLEGLRNVVLLERPIRLGAALSLIRSAIRGRQRQYELRNLLQALAAAREEAESANRLKDEFLATLSHELRTPLNAILGWTTMLRDGHLPQSQVGRAVETIYRNAMAQVQIVNDLLDISRIVRGNVHLSAKLVSLAPMLTLAVDSVRPTAEAKGLRIMTSIAPEPMQVWADQDRLQQVLWNLLSNAVKFTPPGGLVEITMRRENEDVCIRVRDTGIGIASAFLPHVFERFRQADGTTTRSHGGLGLGLSIVRHLVELHGGRVEADSLGEGQGSTFKVLFPIRDLPVREAPRSRVRPPSRDTPVDLDGVNVLIVDDEPDARDLLRTMLAGTGARIAEAGSVEEALRSISSNAPHIVLGDVAMPGRDGYSMIRRMRELPQGATIRAIAVSAYARQEDKARALAAGYDAHLPKPVRPEQLYETLERVWQSNAPSLLHHSDSDASVH